MSKTAEQLIESVAMETKHKDDLIENYVHITRNVLPALARSERQDWPISQDHCFQRVVLDHVCGGVWYAHIKRPAYKHLTEELARRAADLCCAIVAGEADVAQLNKQSLIWRGKWRGRA
ncbi:MAG: hypothetical protein AAF607_10360 [Pseudomonadota bacterium]